MEFFGILWKSLPEDIRKILKGALIASAGAVAAVLANYEFDLSTNTGIVAAAVFAIVANALRKWIAAGSPGVGCLAVGVAVLALVSTPAKAQSMPQVPRVSQAPSNAQKSQPIRYGWNLATLPDGSRVWVWMAPPRQHWPQPGSLPFAATAVVRWAGGFQQRPR